MTPSINSRRQRNKGKIPRNVVPLGLVGLLTDASSEMICPLIPIFVGALGSDAVIFSDVFLLFRAEEEIHKNAPVGSLPASIIFGILNTSFGVTMAWGQAHFLPAVQCSCWLSSQRAINA